MLFCLSSCTNGGFLELSTLLILFIKRKGRMQTNSTCSVSVGAGRLTPQLGLLWWVTWKVVWGRIVLVPFDCWLSVAFENVVIHSSTRNATALELVTHFGLPFWEPFFPEFILFTLSTAFHSSADPCGLDCSSPHGLQWPNDWISKAIQFASRCCFRCRRFFGMCCPLCRPCAGPSRWPWAGPWFWPCAGPKSDSKIDELCVFAVVNVKSSI